MPKSFPVRILTPLGEVARMAATYLRVPTADGLLGIMAGHAPLVAQIAIGPVRLTEPEGNNRWFATTTGVLRVTREEALLLVEAAEEAAAIDVERARRAFERAQYRLRRRPPETDISRAELALARALNRLRVAEYAER
jgi:F-type H+-transporting ATPase subunit epsilon